MEQDTGYNTTPYSLRGSKLSLIDATKVRADSPRERLLGAIIGSVSRHAYRATMVKDLAETPGVSSHTFYDHFA